MVSARTKLVSAYVGSNVKRWRLRRDLTQEELAEAADVDTRFIQKIESGNVDVGAAVLVALAEALRVRPGVLLRVAALVPQKPGRPTKPSGRRSR